MDENAVATMVFDEALRIHRKLGPGLLESVYKRVLVSSLQRRGLSVEEEVWIDLEFEGEYFERAFRADLVVNSLVVVEVKSLVRLPDVARSQVLTYARIMGLRLGLVLNFGERLLSKGFHRVANGVPEPDLSARDLPPT